MTGNLSARWVRGLLLACMTTLFMPPPSGEGAEKAAAGDCLLLRAVPAGKEVPSSGPDLCLPCHAAQPAGGNDLRPLGSMAPSPCSGCHDKLIRHAQLHPPVAAEGCLTCHSPHASKDNRHLRGEYLALCTTCHVDLIPPEATVFHGNIRKSCSSCHSVHGAPYRGLLWKNFNTSFFVDFDNEQYEMCFECHKIDLLLHPKTSYNTEFRDGKKNLHYVHVNRRTRGRSCKFCHEIHAGTQSKLMKSNVSFGDWAMPIRFVPTAKGGSCTPGCHQAASYDRTKK